jgi:hypothetical protein
MFVLRIELKDVPESKSREVYEKLHLQLQKSGFIKRIQADTGTWYKLPDATYIYARASDTESVRNLAATCAGLTGYGSRVIVFEYSNSAWQGLDVDYSISSSLTM